MVSRPSQLLSHCRGRHVMPLAAALLLAYFAWHAVDGRYGLLAWRDYQRELDVRQAELAALQKERARLEQRVDGLRGAIDPDLLDEQARRTLSLVGPLDVIILLDARDRGAATVPGVDGH